MTDYSKLTLEELLIEQKKIKKQQMYTAGLVGLLIGVIVYGLVINGFGWLYIGISVFMIYIISSGSKKLKQHLELIKTEIEKKNPA
ncbi:hypothetical protein EGI26_16895 [Lacihabitans sp. CCS-44]|uniref:hypothetical protein n=1 Tax=Lacihabitans sp. CCS-44 TaxID=2487331 RepID=UPI0020CEC530|nr:hypothetical protein [Lacihabitans sp. CCS-44]MCP9756845.1 hypothetical protein [Lacihabitans sp. CCS-44]